MEMASPETTFHRQAIKICREITADRTFPYRPKRYLRLACRATVEHCAPVLPAVDETFLASAPTRFVEAFEIALPASAVWAELTRDRTLGWCRGLEIRWLSARPFGVGTKRQAKLFGVLLRVREEYFIWEEGRRMAFFVTAVRPPAYRRSAEDYVVEALGADRCRFTWTLAFDLTWLGKLNGPLSSLIVRRMFADTRRHFEQLAAQR